MPEVLCMVCEKPERATVTLTTKYADSDTTAEWVYTDLCLACMKEEMERFGRLNFTKEGE